MKRPSFQFYPGDWTGNSNLKRCSHAEKGIWVDVLCLMHDQAEYGILRWPLEEIAQASGCKVADLRALVRKGVLKGADDRLTEAFVYAPRSGRKDGEPVTLVAEQAGPIWYSSRMVKDEYVRTIRGESTRFGDEDGEAPKPSKKRSPKPPIGDGSSSSSSSSTSVDENPSGSGAAKSQRPSRKVPVGFEITAEMRAWAAANHSAVRVDSETEKFRDHTFKIAISDWAGAWRNWIRRADEGRLTPFRSDGRRPEARAADWTAEAL